jgi:cell wall-associated NlpC family hydrolase
VTSADTIATPGIPAGVYGCVRTRGLVPLLIRTATGSPYDHAFVVIGDGRIVEAEPGGVRIRDITEYAGCRIAYNTAEPVNGTQRAQVAAFATNLRGERYNWGADTVDGLAALGIRWRILGRLARARRSVMCSELIAEAGRSAGLDWLCGQVDPSRVVPGMLAKRIANKGWG